MRHLSRPFRLALAGLAATLVVAVGATGYWLARPLVDPGPTTNEARPAAPEGTPAVASGVARDSQLIAQGTLMGADSFHFGSGRVQLLRAEGGAGVLRFEEYEVRNGPDLFVYLTPDSGGDVDVPGALSLGMVRATRGSVNYEVPAGVDTSSFRSAVIWCRTFDVTFALARFE